MTRLKISSSRSRTALSRARTSLPSLPSMPKSVSKSVSASMPSMPALSSMPQTILMIMPGAKAKQRRARRRRIAIAVGAGAGVVALAAAAVPLTRMILRRTDARTPFTPVADGTIDDLTGLPNRDEAMRCIGEALDRAQQTQHRAALIYVDIDQFEHCNELHGRSAGDHVLQVTGARMQAQLRTGDTVCRLGEDDFVVLMEPAGPDHMLARIADRILESIQQPITYDGETIVVDASCGLAVAPEGASDAEAMLAQGRRAIERARASGRHVVQF